MSVLALSPAAAGLLRALVARSGAAREHVLISNVTSRDWHSLTFSGERHLISMRITGEQAVGFAARMVHRLEDSEFSIPGILVADIAVADEPNQGCDGSVALSIEALTLIEA